MPRLEISATQDYFLRDGEPFFCLADTAWMAFANLPLAEWPRYLAHRKMQGFNALLISILPITHDTSVSDQNIEPFLRNAQGNWDFTAYHDAYFAKAATMVEMAVAQGFLPLLGVLWCSYVPGTRCAQTSPEPSVMPLDAVAPYAAYAAARFREYDPVYFISGDTHFESPDEAPYYMAALQAVRATCPNAPLTMHLSSRGELPAQFVDAVDFYMYASGHSADRQKLAYGAPERVFAYPAKRPFINGEPCYEGHARVGGESRFNAFDVRKATWQSLLAGAKAGIAYGAHGVWSFHRRGMRYLNAARGFEPFDWDVALTLDGAWDVGFAKWLFETYALFDLEPSQLVVTGDEGIRAAADHRQDKLVVYSAHSCDIELALDLAGYRCLQFNLSTRRVLVPEVESGTRSTVRLPGFNTDTLFIAVRSPRQVS